ELPSIHRPRRGAPSPFSALDVHTPGWFSTGSARLSTREPESQPLKPFWAEGPRGFNSLRPMARTGSPQSSGRERRFPSRVPRRRAALVGVDQLPDGRDLAAQLVVDGDLAVDLLAGMQDRGMVTPAELGTDPEQRDVRLLAHQEHRDLARHDDRLVALLAL